MTFLSVKTLHHYHEIGLLPPAIDPASGYRRYQVGQVATAQVIRRLRDIAGCRWKS
ncbi:MAG: MerR family DNA-binding transcriptional regulator [Chloroflexia bacterium]